MKVFQKASERLKARVNNLWEMVNRHLGYILDLRYRATKQENRVKMLEQDMARILSQNFDSATYEHGMEQRVKKLGEELGRLRIDHNVVAKEFDKMRMKLIKLDKASGGFWKAASGYVMRIRDMSDDHIKRCLLGKFGGPVSRTDLQIELKRREEEDYRRKQPMPGEPFAKARDKAETEFVYNNGDDPDVAAVGMFVGFAYGVPVYIDRDTPTGRANDVKSVFSRRPM